MQGGNNVCSCTANPAVVAVEYRLGIFEFFTLPQLKSGTDPSEDSGNCVLLDIIKALRFVDGSNGSFDGNPGNGTLMGQSAGGIRVWALLNDPPMATVKPCELAQASFLRKYAQDSGYADCYVTEVAGSVSQAAFVEAFYTTWLFKIERAILKWLAGRPSTDIEAKQLSVGSVTSFAAWRVEDQSAEQLLLAHFTGRTRSWLMAVVDDSTATGTSTRLYFGSAVVPMKNKTTGARKMGFAFHALLGFHRLYSRLLLSAAGSRVLRDS